MIASVEPLSAGFALADPKDPRHQYLTSLKQRFGALLCKASTSMRTQSEENVLDAVHMLVRPSEKNTNALLTDGVQIRSIRTYMLDYGDSRDKFVSCATPISEC